LVNWKENYYDVDGNVSEGTLDRDGIYTCLSDIFQVGVMMLEDMQPISEDGRAFAVLLKSKKWTAEKALRLPYCSC
jgi:hypothetical protein